MSAAARVARERARLVRLVVTGGGAAALALVATVVAGATLALGQARWITRPAAPLVMWGVALALAAGSAWWTRRAIRRAASLPRLAATIEREHALRAGSLRGALEVAGAGALGRLAAERVAAALPRALIPALRRRTRHRMLALAGAAGAAVVAAGAAAARAPDGWQAVRHPVRAWRGTLLPRPTFLDAPGEVLRGGSVRLRIAAPGRRRLVLATRATGATWRSQMLAVRGTVAEATVGPLDADLVAVASDGRAVTDTVRVRVTDRPFVGDVALRAEFPAYLDRPPVALPMGEPARLPRGTVVRITGRATAPLTRIALARAGDTLGLAPEGLRFGGRLSAETSGRWEWIAATAGGPIADVPAPLEITVLPDSAPQVEIIAPARDTLVLPDAVVRVAGTASDDHALGAVTVRSWRRTAEGADLPATEEAMPGVAGPRWSAELAIALAPRNLAAGDELHVVLIATDQSPWRQRASSRELVLRVPSLAEQRARARAFGDSLAARAGAAATAQRELTERTDEAARSRTDRGGGAGSGSASLAQQEDTTGEADPTGERALRFASAEQARALAATQRQLQSTVRALERDAREMERRLRAAGALDSALAGRLAEAQRLLAQALTPELERQLGELAQASQQLDATQVRRSLAELARQQQRLREQLERSAQMLQRAALEGAMQTLTDEARDLAAAQRELADSLARGNAPAPARERSLARSLEARARTVAEQANGLASRLREQRAEAGPTRLAEASSEARQSAAGMRRAAGDSATSDSAMSDSAMSNSAAGDSAAGDSAAPRTETARAAAARQGAAAMERSAQQLSQARQAQIGEWKQQTTGELDRAIGETLQLARAEQALAQRARAGAARSALQGEQGALQQGADRVAQRLQRAARASANISPEAQGAVAEARRQVRAATQQLASRGGGDQSGGDPEAAQRMDAAAQALERAAAQMTRDRVRAASSTSASGFPELLQRLQAAARAQGALNGDAAGLLPRPGMQPGAGAQAQARALAQRQRALAEQLARGGSAAGDRTDALATEMRRVADALDRGGVSPAVIARQQRLFRRLLDAGLSLEQDTPERSGPRESRSADPDNSLAVTNTDATGPAAVRFRAPTWSELRGLSPEERRAVLEYFQRINAVGGEAPRP